MIDITVSSAAWIDHLDDVQVNQVPFALKNALNMTAVNFQSVQRASMHEEFTVRADTWVDRSVKITHFATKSDPSVTIAIQPPGSDGAGRADILGKFEDQTVKTPIGQHIAVPIDVKRNKREIVPPNQRPRAFNFRQEGRRILGDRGTFIIKKPNGTGLILQRTGSGKSSTVKLLYLLVSQVRIKPDLHFEANAIAVVERAWDVNFELAFEQAMATAR